MTSVKKYWNDEAVFWVSATLLLGAGYWGWGSVAWRHRKQLITSSFWSTGWTLVRGTFPKKYCISIPLWKKWKEKKRKEKTKRKNLWNMESEGMISGYWNWLTFQREFYISFGNWIMIVIVLQSRFSFSIISIKGSEVTFAITCLCVLNIHCFHSYEKFGKDFVWVSGLFPKLRYHLRTAVIASNYSNRNTLFSYQLWNSLVSKMSKQSRVKFKGKVTAFAWQLKSIRVFVRYQGIKLTSLILRYAKV